MIKFKKLTAALLACLMVFTLVLSGCGSSSSDETSTSAENESETVLDSGYPEIPGLTYESSLDLQYAECFNVYFYEDGYSVITVDDDRTYLIVPEDGTVPEGLSSDICVLEQPLDNIYLAATSAMSLFAAADAMDNISFTALKADSWYVDAAVEKMNSGDIQFAGKYSAPDYEMLVNDGCDLAIESTMILHTPNVQEMIEELGVPVFIDRSSYEPSPLGRTEWIKAYGVITGHLTEAEEFFSEQANVLDNLTEFPDEEPTVVYFYINSSGQAVIRGSGDYISTMISEAGGEYPFDISEQESGRANIAISFEEFYAVANTADYLIYNGSIDSSVTSLSDLISQNELFEEFKAVQNGNVWITGKSLYQATDIVSQFVLDVNRMINGGDASEMTFITPLQ